MASPMMLQRCAPLVSGLLGVFGLSIPASAVDVAVAIGDLCAPNLEKRLRGYFEDLPEAVEHARGRAGDEAVAVEAFVSEWLTADREQTFLAAVLGRDEFARILAGAGAEGFGGPARHYLGVLVPEVHRIVHELALAPEVFPEWGAPAVTSLYSTLSHNMEALRKAQVTPETLASLIEELRESLTQELRAEILRRPPRIVEGVRPRLVSHFVSRAEQGRVREVLSDPGTATLCAVAGFRGVGKSQLASWFAEECVKAGWGFVGWVVASSRAAAVTGMAGIARAHGIAPSDSGEDEAASRLVAWLSGSGPDPRLLVFDNVESVDELEGLVPRGPGMRVLVTTTSHTDALGPRVEVGVFSPEQAVKYLTAAAGNPDRDGAALVCEELGYLPLALTQAAATIRLLGCTYAEYREVLDQRRLDEAMRRPEGQGYPWVVGAALWLAFESVTQRLATQMPAGGAAGIAVLDAVSLLADQGMPRAWLYEATDDHMVCREAVGHLLDGGILTESKDEGTVSLHRLQGRVWREHTTPGVAAAARVLSRVTFPTDDWPRERATAHALAAQLIALLNQPYSRPLAQHPDVLVVANETIYHCVDMALPSLAIQLAPYTDLHADILGPDHLHTLLTRGNLASAHHTAGHLAQAIELYEQTLADQQRVLGSDHPDTLTTRSNLAAARRDMGHPEQAIPLLTQTLADQQRILGSDHPDTLTTRSNLAAARRDMGHPEQAIPLLTQTLADQQRVLGPDHPHTLTTRSNLAGAHRDAGRPDQAIALYKQILADQQCVLEPDHPDTLITQHNLAGAYRDAGRLGRAIALYEQILPDIERVLGPDHPHTFTTRNNLAGAHYAAGRPDHAIEIYEQLLPDQERVLGLDHPHTLATRGNLAIAYLAAGRLDRAVVLYEQVLPDMERVLGPDHPGTLITRNNLAAAREQALAGPDAPETTGHHG